MRPLILAAIISVMPVVANAEQTTLIDVAALPSKTVWDAAQLTPLALTSAGAPAVILLDLADGEVVPPHSADGGLRLLTVIAGDMSWGDGDTVDEAKESVYPAGSVLTLPAGLDHWLAARNGDVRLQLILLDDETPARGIAKQMK